MKEKSLKMNIPKIDDLFTTQEERDYLKATKVEDIDINMIDDFPNHPFKVYNDEKMEEMVESIKENGVMIPAIVRKKEDGRYEMVSGHRRRLACKLAKIEKLPCIVKDLTDEEATILMVDTNMQQRELILPSEKAFAYKMKLEAQKHQGLTYGPQFHKLARDIITDEMGGRQVQRYIRLTYLIKELRDLVDNQVINDPEKPKMAIHPAVELSYLTEREQKDLIEAINYTSATPSHAQARILRNKSENGELDLDIIISILEQEKPNQKKKMQLPYERFKGYFPENYTVEQAMNVIEDFLKKYKMKWQQKGQER